MKISIILIALVTLFSIACSSNNAENDHGHEHGTEEHGHEGEAAHQQEEFIIKDDSTHVKNDSAQQHTHEDGSTHHEH